MQPRRGTDGIELQMVAISPHRKSGKGESSISSKKSFNNLSIVDPLRDLMDMHYGCPREQVTLYA